MARNWRMPLIGNIKLNSSINWEDPAKQAYILDGRKVTGDFLAGNAAKLGIRSVTPEQYMDLTILHELGHSFGMNSQDRDERPIWTNCFK